MSIMEYIKEKSESFSHGNVFRSSIETKYVELSALVKKRFGGPTDIQTSRWQTAPIERRVPAESDKATSIREAENVFALLNAKLGQELHIGEWYTVTQECVNQFADATGDRQWVHTDQERARHDSPFKCTIAHGFLTLSLIPFLTNMTQTEESLFPGAKLVVNYGLNKVRFPHPIKVGSRIRARTILTELTLTKRCIEVISEVQISVNENQRLACVAGTIVRVYF